MEPKVNNASGIKAKRAWVKIDRDSLMGSEMHLKKLNRSLKAKTLTF